jgi:peptidoglycan/LPS O-acetylase OafA/YrhL
MVPADRLPSLDGLRAFSIIAVIAGHLSGTRGWLVHTETTFTTSLGRLGVTVFFVISGFLITSLLLSERKRYGTISLKLFYARRALRIVPAFGAFVLAMALLSHLGWVELRRLDVITALTWTMNFNLSRSWVVGHIWSLSVEEQFYLLWPFVIYMLSVGSARAVAIGVFCLAPIATIAMRVLAPHSPIRDLPVFMAVYDAIAVGCFVAMTRDKLLQTHWWRFMTLPPLAPFLTALVVAISFYSGYTLIYVFATPVALVGVAMIVEGSTRWQKGIGFRILNSRMIVWIGLLSYSLYLWQQPFLNRAGTSVWTGFPLNILATLALAVASYYLVEMPTLSLRRTLHASARSRESDSTVTVSGQSAHVPGDLRTS